MLFATALIVGGVALLAIGPVWVFVPGLVLFGGGVALLAFVYWVLV